VTPLRVLVLLLLAGCSAPPADDASRRGYWQEQVEGVFACRSREALAAFLDRIRTLPPRRPRNAGGGSYQWGKRPPVHDDLYPLDETWDLYVIWNDEDPAKGIRSVEVVGFPDLKDHLPPDYREALQALHRSPSAFNPASVDPVLLLRAVNAVQALGVRARPALQAYADLARSLPFDEIRKHSIDAYRLLPVVQLLAADPSPFVLGDGGVANPGWRLFPLVVEEGVPFLVVTGYRLAGKAEAPDSRLKAGFAVSAGPWIPAVDPVEAVERLTASADWAALTRLQSAPQALELRRGIRRQALEALATVYRPPDDFSPRNCCEDPSEAAWRQVVQEVRALGIRWDPERQDFIRSR